jgi:hypothetical protein
MTTTAARAEAASAENFKPWTRPEMAARLARDIPEGWCVNLGIGIPLLVSNFVKGAIWLRNNGNRYSACDFGNINKTALIVKE